ncbi:MAG: hypothetical protein HQL47_10970 [Gammaproteobacteria bacterium]|nr:hypothetical protein [Gammaproteobacteria bacterium]
MSAIHHRLKQGYWLRQLALLLRRGEPMESALARLVQVAEDDRPQLKALLSHYQGTGRLAGFDSETLWPLRLRQLLERVHPRQEAMTLAHYAELHQAIEGPAEDFFDRLQALAAYFSGLGLFLLVLINFILIGVVGSLGELFASFGAELSLPAPTQWLLQLHPHAAAIGYASGLIALLLLIGLLLLRRGLRRRQGVPWLLRLMPFTGAARHAFADAEAVQLTQVLVRAGVPYEKALFIAIQLVGGSRGLRQLEPLLGQAAQLGGVDEELGQQAAQLVQAFDRQARQALQRLMLSAYLLLGLAIGFVVVAAYLPIFSLGDLI